MGDRLLKGAVGAAVLLAAGGVAFGAALSPPPLEFKTLAPPASIGTYEGVGLSGPTGIVGNLITNTVQIASNGTAGGTIGALYDRDTSVWTPIVVPSAAATAAYGPARTRSGYRIVGSYKTALSSDAPNHAFFYDSAAQRYVTIDPPPTFCAPQTCNEAIAHSNFGDATFKVVGNADAVGNGPRGNAYPGRGHAFLYDSATRSFAKIDVPRAVSTTAYGIWSDPGEVAVTGGFTDARGTHGYVRGLTSGKMLVYDHRPAVITHFEGITGAGGAGDYNLAGDYVSVLGGKESGFFLPVRHWKAGKPVLLGTLSANSIYKRTVVGIRPAPETTPKAIGFSVEVPGP
ncbi:MAG: outer rane autotransporter barrel domain [Candidatus Eremiobacteraeota bacterium]|nr:outer rane autotransporter barrel domain [Candidatus Eremiobacteraeota bacterium]